jgi:L-alanine-DL-glutamate epimerase-like enolase superfamily enzyme
VLAAFGVIVGSVGVMLSSVVGLAFAAYGHATRPPPNAVAVHRVVGDTTPLPGEHVEQRKFDREAGGHGFGERRQADTPLAQWLTDEILDGRTPPASVPVNATIPATEPKHTRQQAENASIQGYDTIKLKATGEYATDRERVEAAREGAPDVDLRLDVNGAWPDLDTARQRMHELAEHDLEYVEQPLAPDAIDEMAQLRQTSPVPIAADEPVLGVESAKRIVQAEAADVLVLKPMVLGGAATTLSIARLAEAHDTPVVVTSTIDGAIARSGALHAAAALGELTHACGLATGPLIQREPAAFDERIERGTMPVPGAPGHGAWLSSSPEAP